MASPFISLVLPPFFRYYPLISSDYCVVMLCVHVIGIVRVRAARCYASDERGTQVSYVVQLMAGSKREELCV